MNDETREKFFPLYFWSKALFVFLLLVAGWHYLFADRAVVELRATTTAKNSFKIYYPNINGHWTERAVSGVSIRPGITTYSFRLKDLHKIKELRIDPMDNEGSITIHSLILRQHGNKPVDILQLAREGKVRHEKETTGIATAGENLTITAKTNDPKLFFSVPELEKNEGKSWTIYRLLLFFLLSIALVKAADRVLVGYRFIIFAMLIITVFAAVMAGISIFNTHPDEKVHCEAAQFYIDNTLPPAVGDPRVEGTYSPYGFSRLYSGELAYFVGGKFARFLQPLGIPDYLAFRYANVTLLTILFFCACSNLTWRILLVPLFLFPQVWYIFSYWNSDALALFLSLCVAWQLADKGSIWNRLLTGKHSLRNIGGGLWLILLLAALFFCKKNFYAYLLFGVLFLSHQIFYKKITANRNFFISLLIIIFSASALAGAFLFWDAKQNNFAKDERIREQAIIHAQKGFNPDAPLEKLRPHLYMKERGFTLEQMIASFWGERSFRSSVGEYGYTSVHGPLNYYHYMRYGLISLGIVVIFFTLLRGGWENTTLMTISTGTACLLIAASFYHSWTMDYQAQGRYLLPVIAILSLFYHSARKALENIVVLSLGTLVFCGGLYSFIFVALAGIGKIAIPF